MFSEILKQAWKQTPRWMRVVGISIYAIGAIALIATVAAMIKYVFS